MPEPGRPAPVASPIVPVASGKFAISDGPWKGHVAYGFRLEYAGDAPLELSELPGTFEPPVAAVLTTGTTRRPRCTPTFAGRTTPYTPLFVDGAIERLNRVQLVDRQEVTLP